jgi:hypothetical protein
MHPCGATSITGEQAVDDVLESRLMPRFVHAHTSPLDPPAHVLAEVDAAWERAQELFAGELELHFDVSGRVTGELRVPGGETLERLTAAEALMLACGDAELALLAA